MMLSNPPPSLTSPPWSPRTKRTIILIVLGLMFLLALQLLRAWSVVLIALILAYLLNPVVNFFEAKALNFIRYSSLRRALAVLLTFVTMIGGLTLVGIVIFPAIFNQMNEFIDNLPLLTESVEDELSQVLNEPITIGEQSLILSEELNGGGRDLDAATLIRETASTLSTPLFSAASAVITFFVNFFFVLVMMFYLMKDGPHFVNSVDKLIPVEYQGDYRRLLYELSQIWDAYLRGQLLLGLIVGVVVGISATILGLPQPLVLGLVAALLEFIPNLGPLLAASPAVLFALFSESETIPGLDGIPFAIVVALTYSAIQQVESLFLVPRVMGKRLDLHPLVVLIAVISGAAVGGLLGVILAAPTVATFRLLITYIWAKVVDIDPFTENGDGDYHFNDHALPDSTPPALEESYSPPQHGEIVDE